MIILDATTKTLEVKLAGAATTTELPFVASYVDINQTTFAMTGAGESDGITTGGTAATIVAAPGATTSRQVKYLSVFNVDTVAAVVTIQVNNNATLRISWKGSLAVGDTLIYIDGNGFAVTDSSGTLRSGASTLGDPVTVAHGGTGLSTITSHGVMTGAGTGNVVPTAEGATNTVLHGNTGAAPTFSAVSLTADVSGTLPVANGGTGATTLTAHGVLIGNTTGAVAVTSAGTATHVLTSNGAAADPTFQAASGAGAMTLVSEVEGTDATASATNVATVAISGLTVKDRLLVYLEYSSIVQLTNQPLLYHATDNLTLLDPIVPSALNASAGYYHAQTIDIGVGQSSSKYVSCRSSGVLRTNSETQSGVLGGEGKFTTVTTDWTGNFTIALRTGTGGVVSGGTFRFKMWVYKIAGQ